MTVIESIQQQVKSAIKQQTPLSIRGSGSKSFLGTTVTGEPVDLLLLNQIIDYEPAELYITAQAGTPLQFIEETLAEQQQMLAFEPPHFGANATLGGMIATGLSGPRRPYCGAVRDALLGLHLINGYGEYLRFGGQVMKNVAGYDVARLMAGAMGTLGIITQATLKVLPRPQAEITRCFSIRPQDALLQCTQWTQQHWPITAVYYHDGKLFIRLSGTGASLRTAQRALGGETINDGEYFWKCVREQTNSFFTEQSPLWRISLPRNTNWLNLPGKSAFEWHGALRWLYSDIDPQRLQQEVAKHHGHARLFRCPNGLPTESEHHAPLTASLRPLHKRIKHAFDPQHIFNRQLIEHWMN